MEVLRVREADRARRGFLGLQGKMKSFENCPVFDNLICQKHTIFATQMSCELFTRYTSVKNLENFSKCFSQLETSPTTQLRVSCNPLSLKTWENNFQSVFHNSCCHSRSSCELVVMASI